MSSVAKKSKSSKPKEAGEEMSGPRFPTEVWLTIFGFLDWENLQEKAVLVCNSWLEIIRGSPKLSGEMALKSDKIKKEDLIAILTRWKELKVLRAIQGDDFDFKGIKFSKSAQNLRQIIVSKFKMIIFINNGFEFVLVKYLTIRLLDLVCTFYWRGL